MKVYAVVTFSGSDRETTHAYFAEESEACFHAEQFEDSSNAKVFITEIEETGSRVDLDDVHAEWEAGLRAQPAAKREP